MCFCCLKDHAKLAGTIICGPEGHLCTEASCARRNHWQRFRQSISKRAMNGFWNDAGCAACVHVCVEAACLYSVVYLCLLYLFQTEHFLLRSRRSGGYGSAAVRKIPRTHSEKRLAFTLCWRGLPMTSFTLTHCLFDPVAVSAVCSSSSCFPP